MDRSWRAAPDREGPHGDRLHRGARRRSATSCASTTTSCSPPRSRQQLAARPRHRPRHAPGGQADGHRRLAGHRLAQGVGRPGPRGPSSSSSSSTSRCAAGAPVPMLTINTVGPDHHGLRHPGAEGVLPPEDPGRRHPLLHRLHRARVGHRPRLAADPGRARRRRVRHQRRRRSTRRLAGDADYIWLATRTDPDVAKHKGISMFVVPMDTPGHQGRAHAPARRPQHQLHVLRGRPGAGGQPGRRREPGLDPHHQPAQPRAGHPVLARASSSGP